MNDLGATVVEFQMRRPRAGLVSAESSAAACWTDS